ncbi:hypothetical protein Fmac_028114 [Flemingia macrophylla]|uniref:Uncharacterized protein n=1 Tax=Flemingia macrophylla TaxID=520843 RepID=A0ABD1LLD0_9FABA
MRSISDSDSCGSEEEMAVKKGPWTEEEDSILINYVNIHGEGHWNSLARSAGLKRTGKSCRLRWLNYLRPNVRRGNITLQEQLLILDLHSRWGNRWAKIAEQLPGRTDNEIKNYWRTRVVKQAKQLKCDVNSKQFRDAVRYVWMPRLMERIQASSYAHGHDKTNNNMCNTNNESSDEAKPIMACDNSLLVSSEPQSLSHATTTSSCNLIGDGRLSWDSAENNGSMSTTLWQHWDYSDLQAFEPAYGFGDADLWTDENICFLQHHLAHDF